MRLFGNIATLRPGFTVNYRRITRKFDLAAYDTISTRATVPGPQALRPQQRKNR